MRRRATLYRGQLAATRRETSRIVIETERDGLAIELGLQEPRNPAEILKMYLGIKHPDDPSIQRFLKRYPQWLDKYTKK